MVMQAHASYITEKFKAKRYEVNFIDFVCEVNGYEPAVENA